MRRVLSLSVTALLAIGGLSLATPTASADTICRATISAPINGNVSVPAGATCTLERASVQGNLTVARGASVSLISSSVNGNLQATAAASVSTAGSIINGNLHAKATTKSVTVNDTTVNGNLQVEDGSGTVSVTGSRINGDLQLFSNVRGAKTVIGNSVNGNLQCKNNNAKPTGRGNTVRGNAEGQCSGLTKGSGAIDLYLTEGLHVINGRTWRTGCEPYSQTVRCRTEIKATQISYANGRFTQSYGWVFNNLTYAPMPKAKWGSNPLANTGKWTASDGRSWRTECNTALTGRNGCRSYVVADVIERRGATFVWVSKEILNNMVRFA